MHHRPKASDFGFKGSGFSSFEAFKLALSSAEKPWNKCPLIAKRKVFSHAQTRQLSQPDNPNATKKEKPSTPKAMTIPRDHRTDAEDKVGTSEGWPIFAEIFIRSGAARRGKNARAGNCNRKIKDSGKLVPRFRVDPESHAPSTAPKIPT